MRGAEPCGPCQPITGLRVEPCSTWEAFVLPVLGDVSVCMSVCVSVHGNWQNRLRRNSKQIPASQPVRTRCRQCGDESQPRRLYSVPSACGRLTFLWFHAATWDSIASIFPTLTSVLRQSLVRTPDSMVVLDHSSLSKYCYYKDWSQWKYKNGCSTCSGVVNGQRPQPLKNVGFVVAPVSSSSSYSMLQLLLSNNNQETATRPFRLKDYSASLQLGSLFSLILQ